MYLIQVAKFYFVIEYSMRLNTHHCPATGALLNREPMSKDYCEQIIPK